MSDNDRHDDATVMSPDRRAAARAQLIAVVNGDTSTRRRPSKPLVTSAAILVGAAASVGAVSLLTHAPVADPYTVECRTPLDPDEEGNYIATATPVTIAGGVTHTLPRPELQDAINMCAQLIATGWPAQTSDPLSFTDGPPTRTTRRHDPLRRRRRTCRHRPLPRHHHLRAARSLQRPGVTELADT